MSARASTPATQAHHHDDGGPKTRRIVRIFVRTDATHRSHTAIPIRPNCFVPEHYKRAANKLLIGEGVCWMRMQNRSIRIDPIHTRAICAGVAEGLRLILPKEQPQPGSSLEKLISRLAELDDAPSIAPD